MSVDKFVNRLLFGLLTITVILVVIWGTLPTEMEVEVTSKNWEYDCVLLGSEKIVWTSGFWPVVPYWIDEMPGQEVHCHTGTRREWYFISLEDTDESSRLGMRCQVSFETWSQHNVGDKLVSNNPRSGPINCEVLS